jgi:collagenase-like PrtC family protease
MKSEYYLATIISNYRKVIDQINAKKKINKQFLLDVENAANRPTDTA